MCVVRSCANTHIRNPLGALNRDGAAAVVVLLLYEHEMQRQLRGGGGSGRRAPNSNVRSSSFHRAILLCVCLHSAGAA